MTRPSSIDLEGRPSATLVLALAACGGPGPNPHAAPADTPVRTVAAREAYGNAIDAVRALLRPIAELGVGVAVAVHRGDSALWVEGLGHADHERLAPVDPEGTLIRVYSLSKPMTAAAGLRLVEAGRLDAAAPVQRYLPSFPEKDRPVTVMGLATHRAGLRHYREGEARSRTPCATVRDALPIFAARRRRSGWRGRRSTWR